VRPDCCTEHLLELLLAVDRLLDEHDIRHWVDWGTLLGAVRNQEFIPWDTDVDLGILERDLEALLALRPEIERAGYKLQREGPSTIRVQYSQANDLSLDIYYWSAREGILSCEEDEAWVWPGMNDRIAFPQEYVERLEPVVLYGREFPAPFPPHALLNDHRYGPDYMTPARPAVAFGLGRAISPTEMTPAARQLLPLVRERSEVLIDLVESSPVGGFARRATPGRGKWSMIAGLPLKPQKRHLEQARSHVVDRDPTESAVEKLVWRLAWVERGIEEYEGPSRFDSARRMCRRLRWLAAGVTSRRDSRASKAAAGYYR
jgi:hypothetical protein